MKTEAPILIAGAGPVGLTAALLLQRRGVDCIVLESQTALPQDLRASTFHPPTLDMLAPLGVTAALLARGLKSPTWQIRMHPSGDRVVFKLDALKDDTDHPYRLQCEQSKLCRVLLDLYVAGGGDIRMGHAVTNATQDETKVTVEATTETGEQVPFSGAFLIGADGSRSAVRNSLDIAFNGSTYPETTILSTTQFPFESALPDLSNVNYVWKEHGTFSLLRLPELWRCSLYPDRDETIEQALEPASIRHKLHEIAPGTDAYEVGEVRPYRIHMRIVDDYRRGRILLAGDAAHVNSPSGGMGMNGGVHDAFELVATLCDVLAGAPLGLLDRYTRRRRPVAEREILQQADRNRARMQERDPAKRRVMLNDLKRVADDPMQLREHLLRTSMIAGLRQAAAVP